MLSRSCNRIVFCFAFIFISIVLGHAQTRISILGDSYSTFIDHVTPSSNLVYYGVVNAKNGTKKNNVHHLSDMWWSRLSTKMKAEIECNNSFSGSTICLTGYHKEDYSDRAFVTRILNLGNPDVIFIFGGTNDAWASSPLGEYQYENWSRKDLFNFRPAFSYLLNQLIMLYPNALLCNVSNCDISEDIIESMATICDYYGVLNVKLEHIDKQSGHPSVEGMRAIAEQVYTAIK